jgi:endonuclease/exonuclease/phosphatase family metal-dependent hydrolase
MLDRVWEGQFGVPHAGPHELRLVSWNIERGYRAATQANYLAAQRADLCLLQEVDLHARRTGYQAIAEGFASQLRYHYAFGAAFRELAQGDSAHHGQATLARFPLRSSRILRFQAQSDFWKPRPLVPRVPPFQPREGGRIALICELEAGGRRVILYNLHLESRGNESLRARQLEEVLADAARYAKDQPVLIGGDLNTKRLESPALSVLRAGGFTDALQQPRLMTTSRGGPLAKLFIEGALDWIWVRGPLQIVSARVDRDIRASDHFPLVVDLRIG